jgi:ATP-dependent helicase/nuclease subunit A
MAAQSVSEEMRVLYVAMTRARDRLIMTYASRTLEEDLKEIAMRMDFDDGELLCEDAICMGDWVLLAAMKRTEAGQLHNLGGRPTQTEIGEYPWKICVAVAPKNQETGHISEDIRRRLPESIVNTIDKALQFQYPHYSATKAPSKQTATGRKGRVKDAEAAEGTKESVSYTRSWRKPSFRSGRVEGRMVGNAIHSAMQYIRYEACESEAAVSEEIRRLVRVGFLTEEQGRIVNCGQIASFFDSELGRKLRSGVTHVREFKFSILDPGEQYGEGLEGEKVLLQGVVDCAILEEDGITVLDFKTDTVRSDDLNGLLDRYRSQVCAYADALKRIYDMPIKDILIYFFDPEILVSVL